MSYYFPEQSIQIFKSSDFNLDSDTKLTLKDKRLIMLLFFDDSVTSGKLVDMWKSLSKEVAGIKYGICNCLVENDVSQTLSSLIQDSNSAYNSLVSNKIPFILIYKNGIPQFYYMGVYSKVKLFDFSITLVSCGNKEIVNVIS